MPRKNRREFLQFAGMGAAFAAFPLVRETPEIILHNANIITMDGALPRAQAVAIVDGRFLAVGTNDEVRGLATARTKSVDLGGKTVTPGFIDAHTHPSYSGLRHLRMVDCNLPSIEKIIAAMRERAAKTAPGEWVMGFKYDDTKTAEGRALTRADLDAAFPDHPVFIEHRGGHTGYVNSLAYKKAGVEENAADPAGGRYDRDAATGKLNGRVAEHGKDLFEKAMPLQFSREDYREGVKLISKMMTRTGLTSVHDVLGSPEDLRAYQDARDSGDLLFRVYCFIFEKYFDPMVAAGVRTGLGDDWVRVGAVKLIADGSISERTARLSVPYLGRPDDYGILVTKEEEHYEQARKAHLAGWQVGTHANGDVAIDQTLRVYERLQKEHPRHDPRFRIEHCTVINDDLVKRIKALGAIPTPFSTYVYYHGEKMKYYGAERTRQMFALRSFLDAGIPATQASDYPPGEYAPMMALQSEVTRTDRQGNVWGANQRISVEEAIRVGTVNGAYASYDEKRKGSIEAGKLADLVVLGRDPFQENPATLVNIPVERTMVGGRWVYEA
ncbi:MAG: amidohydrolase [Acidobacteriia bacterium]|nr:amidohydrolase [Terriglobia bacterium]